MAHSLLCLLVLVDRETYSCLKLLAFLAFLLIATSQLHIGRTGLLLVNVWAIWLAVQSFRLFLPRACTTVTLGGLQDVQRTLHIAKHSLWRSVYSQHSRVLEKLLIKPIMQACSNLPHSVFLIRESLAVWPGLKFQSFIFCWAGQPVFIPGSVTYQPHYLGQVAVCKWWVVADGFLLLTESLAWS